MTELGEIYTEEGRLESFIEVYKKLGKQPSEEQLIKIGVKCREKGWLTSAAKAFEMAGYVEGLREIANEWLKKGCVKQATDIYKKLDDEKMLNFLKQFLP
ncbi:MAG: hypothetical protein QW423_02985 [Candidatus Aenigmatarchaeota archaeon]